MYIICLSGIVDKHSRETVPVPVPVFSVSVLVVLVQKKDRTSRFCGDYRKVNTVTQKDAYPLSTVESMMCDPAKIEKIVNWPVPTNKRFLGLVSYYIDYYKILCTDSKATISVD